VTPLSGYDRLSARLAVLVVTEANFLTCARTWRSLRKHRARLRDMAARYPLIIEFADLRFVLEAPDEVDRLTADVRAKLKECWVSGINNGSESRE
jgi:hypothetical protein